ncbi:MAG: sensor domain-containing diguanylate cyclase [Candidatus Firestonebacteria bacterium]
MMEFIKRSSTLIFMVFAALIGCFLPFSQPARILFLIFFLIFLGLDIIIFSSIYSLKESFRQLQYIEELTGALKKSAKLKDVLELAIKNLVEEFSYNKILIFTFEHIGYRKDILVPAAGFNVPMEVLKDFHFNFDKAEDIVPKAAVERRPFIIHYAKEDHRCSQSFVEKLNLSEFAVVPLTINETIVGVFLIADKKNGKHLVPKDLITLSAYSSQTAVAIENAKLYEKIEQLAITDALTNTYNQRYFNETLKKELERLKRYYKTSTEKVSVILLELDNLKVYRERFGYHAGDTVLIEVGQILKNLTRKVDVVSRYGNEEFAIMLPSTAAEGAAQLAERIRQGIEEYPFEKREELSSKKLTVSFGLATYDDDGKSPSDIMEAVNKRLVEFKAKSKKTVSYL